MGVEFLGTRMRLFLEIVMEVLCFLFDERVFCYLKGGIVEVLSMTRKWKGYTTEFEGSQKLVFTLKEPNSSCFLKNIPVKISIESSHYGGDHRSFAVAGYFPNRVCSIVDSLGNAIAQVGGCKEIEMESKDIYNVIVKPGIDQAFVIGVIAILDYIYGGSTRC
nr:protein LURP-one-related 6 [Ipomoea batatas]